jgi:hypothetical protein
MRGSARSPCVKPGQRSSLASASARDAASRSSVRISPEQCMAPPRHRTKTPYQCRCPRRARRGTRFVGAHGHLSRAEGKTVVVRAVILIGGGVLAALATAQLAPRTEPERSPAAAARAAPRSGAQWLGTPGTTTINAPRALPRVLVSTPRTANDEPEVTASCTTCHASRTPDVRTASSSALDEFHGDLMYRRIWKF